MAAWMVPWMKTHPLWMKFLKGTFPSLSGKAKVLQSSSRGQCTPFDLFVSFLLLKVTPKNEKLLKKFFYFFYFLKLLTYLVDLMFLEIKLFSCNHPAVRKPRPVRPCSPITNPSLPLKKKSKEGKGKHNLRSLHGSKGEKVGNYRFSLS